MKAPEILDNLARARRVETLCREIVAGVSAADMADLVQVVYLALLNAPAAKIERMAAAGQLDFYITGIIRKQWASSTSQFYSAIRKFRAHSVEYKDDGR